MKKIIILTISFVLALLLSCNAYAETLYILNGYTFELSDYGTAIIVGWDNSSEKLIVPEKIGEYFVSDIGSNAFENDLYIKNLDFSYASRLFTIDNFSFYNSSVTGELFIPSRITYVGNSAFEHCTKIEKVELCSNGGKVRSQCFKDCDNLIEVKLSENIKSIESYAFSGCTSLSKIVIPRTVTAINNTSFEKDNNLVIFCYKNSYAEKFAINNGYQYELLDGIVGDVNNDNSIDILDVTCVQKYRVGIFNLDESGLYRADVNRDGQVTVRDATIIQMYLAQMTQDYIK